MARTRDPARPRQILDAALELFGKQGYQHTQIADIAAELGIGHGTVYRYFENKRDLFEKLMDEIIGDFATDLQQADPRAPQTLREYEDQLRLIGAALARRFSERPATLKVVLQAENLDPEMNARFRNTMTTFAFVSAARIQNGVDRGFLRADLDVMATAELMVAVTIEALRRSIASDDPARHARYHEAAVALTIRGIARQPTD